MRTSFLGYYRPDKEQFSELWKNCVFILDANVLLNLYRYPKEARDDLLRVLDQVSDRLWVPHQAALEYQENRLGVIAGQVRKFDEVREVLAETRKCLEGGLARLQLKKKHSAIKPDQLLAKVEGVFSEFGGELDTLEQEQPDVYDDDELRDQIDSLLEGKIGPPPKSQSELDKIYEEGRIRYEHKYPPGYGDTGKAQPGERETCSYGGLAIRGEYGDLILWFQIIEAAKAKKLKHIIFVTDDEKEDWWWTVKSRGKKTIGPRPELVEELHRKAGVLSFYMYNSERFLEFAKQYLGAQVDQESIDQVREIVQLREAEWKGRRRTSIAYQMQVERAVAQWLRYLCPHDEIVSNERGFPDLVLVSDRDRIGYEVKYIRGEPTFIRHMMRERVHRAYYEINEGRLDSLKFVVVVDDEEKVEKAIDILSRPQYEIPDGVSFVVGLLKPSEIEGSHLAFEFVQFFET